jgi:hypothetical protein
VPGRVLSGRIQQQSKGREIFTHMEFYFLELGVRESILGETGTNNTKNSF